MDHAMRLPAIPKIDTVAQAEALRRHNSLTKPAGSLGRIEELGIQLAAITGKVKPSVARKAVIVMAADHGVAREGVSAYPQEVTAQMVLNFLRGGAAINVLARQADARVVVVDMGIASELPKHTQLENRRIAAGTQNLLLGPAMTRAQATSAIEAGIAVLEAQYARGLDLVATGDMGIGNTTASAAIVSVLTALPPNKVTGRGTGVDDAGMQRKIAAIECAIALNRPDRSDVLDVVAKVGGFEIAGLAGVIIAAASRRVPIVVDGFISGAAALIAAGLEPDVKPYLFAGHRSVEIGHHATLEHLGLRPLLDLDLRLGEGTGAVLAFHLFEAAARILSEMATFSEASVTSKPA